MSEPSREHIEAVASLIDEWLYRMHGIQSSCRHEVEAAELLSTKDPAVLDAMQDALVRAGRLHKVHDAHYDIVATDEDGQKVFQHGGSDPWRLRQWLADHPNRYRPGSRVERRIARWLTTDTTVEWEPWEPIP